MSVSIISLVTKFVSKFSKSGITSNVGGGLAMISSNRSSKSSLTRGGGAVEVSACSPPFH